MAVAERLEPGLHRPSVHVCARASRKRATKRVAHQWDGSASRWFVGAPRWTVGTPPSDSLVLLCSRAFARPTFNMCCVIRPFATSLTPRGFTAWAALCAAVRERANKRLGVVNVKKGLLRFCRLQSPKKKKPKNETPQKKFQNQNTRSMSKRHHLFALSLVCLE